jgi:phosphoglycerate dehydrogenase-like enzyme
MPAESLTIWCDLNMGETALAALRAGTAEHRLVLANGGGAHAEAAASLDGADVAFGQPEADRAARSPRLAWVHLSSAGYTPYDRDSIRSGFAGRGAALTNSSAVYADPCAEHVLAFMLAEARQLARSIRHQAGDRAWATGPTRAASALLRGQTVALVGFGAIARRLVELLAPFRADIVAVRHAPRGDEPVPTVSNESAETVLGRAHHVVDLLPARPDTARFFDARRFAQARRGTVFYNVGRGSTVDQDALRSALESEHLRAAYLDVTDPEPLPADHPLWSTRGCVITPHAAGGHAGEDERLVEHFLANLERFRSGRPLLDRIV